MHFLATAGVLAVGAVTCVIAADGCVSDEDCHLAGECIAGTCRCDAWATGPKCDLLNPMPVPRWGPDNSSMGYWNATRASWGGKAIEVNGTWHLFAAEMQGGALLSNWS